MDYKSLVSDGDKYRKNYIDGINSFILRKNQECFTDREEFMPPEDFSRKIETYRRQFTEMLGIDKFDAENLPESILTLVAEDEECCYYRVVVYITSEIPFHGLLIVPKGIKKAPLIISQHGGGGTPELCSDMNGKNNYNHMVKRLVKKGAVVFAPQLLLWNVSDDIETAPKHPIPFNRHNIDKELKRFGISITGLEIKGIMNSISFLSSLDIIDKEKIGMTGLSYGGYFTLYVMAADERIKAGYSNAAFNDRNVYSWSDWCYFNSANTFHDAEVAALCAPRKLYVAIGTEDKVFDYKSSLPEAQRVKKYYEAFHCEHNFVFDVWKGGHTLSSGDEGFDFLFSAFEQNESTTKG